MSQIIIKGGKKLAGIWPVSGNKNEALPLIAVSCLFKNGLLVKNVPKIEDVNVMIKIAQYLGVRVTKKENDIFLKAPEKIKKDIPVDLASKIRASLLFIPSLLISYGKAIIPRSGGDKIGVRKIDIHLEVFEKFGSSIKNDVIVLNKIKFFDLRPIKIWLSEPSVTATENALIMASARKGKTIIKNAACEPHIVGLGNLLKKAGANISGLGTNIIEISGHAKFNKTVHTISEDYIETGSALVLSALSEGRIKVKTNNTGDYEKIFESFKYFGKQIVSKNSLLRVVNGKENKKYNTIQEIACQPWPNFPSDLMSPFIVLATQSNGVFLFHEKMYESRLYFIDQLKNLGANLVLCDPHRVLVYGPSKLKNAHLTTPDIRAGMALVLAILVARGKSTIDNAEQLDRGYENIVQKLKNIGAQVSRK